MKYAVKLAGYMALVTSLTAGGLVIGGCQHEIDIVAPEKPIEINLNVKIDQEVRVRLDKEVEDLITDNPDLF